MGFGNIGIGELMVVLLVVMLVFGPKRLPEIARNMGKFMRDFRRETNAAIRELKEGIEPINVGIFDEPDASPTAPAGNGAPAALPGASAAGGAGVAQAPVTAEPAPDGARANTRSKAAKRKTPASATRKPSSSAPRRKTASAAKQPAQKKKNATARTRATRKR